MFRLARTIFCLKPTRILVALALTLTVLMTGHGTVRAQDPAPAPTAVPTAVPDVVVVAARLTVRAGPGNQFPSLGQVARKEALTVTAQIRKCAWIKVSTAANLSGWIPGQRAFLRLQKSCDQIPDAMVRPPSSVIKSGAIVGSGNLAVSNLTGTDGVVVLTTLEDQFVVSAYVRTGDSFDIGNIPVGTFYLYFATGIDFFGETDEFLSNARRMRFKDTFDFMGNNGWTVTLHAVPGGNAGAIPVGKDLFPSVSP